MRTETEIKAMLQQLDQCYRDITSEKEKQELFCTMEILQGKNVISKFYPKMKPFIKRAEKWLNDNTVSDEILFI